MSHSNSWDFQPNDEWDRFFAGPAESKIPSPTGEASREAEFDLYWSNGQREVSEESPPFDLSTFVMKRRGAYEAFFSGEEYWRNSPQPEDLNSLTVPEKYPPAFFEENVMSSGGVTHEIPRPAHTATNTRMIAGAAALLAAGTALGTFMPSCSRAQRSPAAVGATHPRETVLPNPIVPSLPERPATWRFREAVRRPPIRLPVASIPPVRAFVAPEMPPVPAPVIVEIAPPLPVEALPPVSSRSPITMPLETPLLPLAPKPERKESVGRRILKIVPGLGRKPDHTRMSAPSAAAGG